MKSTGKWIALTLALVILAAVSTVFIVTRPLVTASDGTAALDNKIDTSSVTALVADKEYDGAVLTVFERMHRFIAPDEEQQSGMQNVVIFLTVAASVPVLILLFFVIDKLDINRARHWYLTCGMSESPAKPWRPIIPWHTQNSRWFERCLRDLVRDSDPDAVPVTRKKKNPLRVNRNTGMMMRKR